MAKHIQRDCDICRRAGIWSRAKYDAKTTIDGLWADLCTMHYKIYRDKTVKAKAIV